MEDDLSTDEFENASSSDFDLPSTKQEQPPQQKTSFSLSMLTGLIGASIIGFIGTAMHYGQENPSDTAPMSPSERRRQANEARSQAIGKQIDDLTAKHESTEQQLHDISNKLDQVLSQISRSQNGENRAQVINPEHSDPRVIPGLDEVFPQFIKAIPEFEKEPVLKNLKLWLTNAVRFAHDSTKTRVDTASQTFKSLFEGNSHVDSLFNAMGYTKSCAYYEVANLDLVKIGLDVVYDAYSRLQQSFNRSGEELPFSLPKAFSKNRGSHGQAKAGRMPPLSRLSKPQSQQLLEARQRVVSAKTAPQSPKHGTAYSSRQNVRSSWELPQTRSPFNSVLQTFDEVPATSTNDGINSEDNREAAN